MRAHLIAASRSLTLEEAIRALRLNRPKKIAGRCRFPKTPFVASTLGR
jgi:hypothetical protein